MAFAIVQSPAAAASATGTPTTAVNWSPAPLQGNLLVLALTLRNIATTSENTSQGWIKGPVATNATTSSQTEIWYRVAAAGEATAGPTFNLGSSILYEIAMAEVSGWAGIPTLDKTGTASGSGVATLATAVSAAIINGSEFLFGGCGNSEGATSSVVFNASTAGGSATFGADIDNIAPGKSGTGLDDAWATSAASGTSPSLTFNTSSSTNTNLSAAVASFRDVVSIPFRAYPKPWDLLPLRRGRPLTGKAHQGVFAKYYLASLQWRPLGIPTAIVASLAESLDSYSETVTRALQSFARTVSETLDSFSEAATRLLALPRHTAQPMALVGSPGAFTANPAASITPSFGQATTAGNALIALVTSNSSNAPATPSGWATVLAASSNSCGFAVFTKASCAANETAPTISCTGATQMYAVLLEITGWRAEFQSPGISADRTNYVSNNAPGSITVTAPALDRAAQELEVSLAAWHLSSAAAVTMTDTYASNATAISLGNSGATSTADHASFAYAFTSGNDVADADTATNSGTVSAKTVALASFRSEIAEDPWVETVTRASLSLSRTSSETLAAWSEAATRLVASVNRTVSDTLASFTEAATRLLYARGSHVANTGVTQSSIGQALTVSLSGAGLPRTAGDLLLLTVAVTEVASVPTPPDGWGLVASKFSVNTAVAVYAKTAAGGDANPTLPAVSGGVISARGLEFRGGIRAPDRQASSAANTSNWTLTLPAVDLAPTELVLGLVALTTSPTTSTNLTVGSSSANLPDLDVAGNSATSTVDHYFFVYGLTTTNTPADRIDFSLSSANVQDTASLLVSLQAAGLARTASETWDAFTELATRLASLARTAGETLASWTETATRIVASVNRTVSETWASLSESATRLLFARPSAAGSTVVRQSSIGGTATVFFSGLNGGAGPVAGDLLLVLVGVTQGNTIPAIPAGWNLVAAKTSTSTAVAIYSKIAVGGDPDLDVGAVLGAVISVIGFQYAGVIAAADEKVTSGGNTSTWDLLAPGSDIAPYEPVLAVVALTTNPSSTTDLTTSNYSSNLGSVSSTNNSASNTVDHYLFAGALTTANNVADKIQAVLTSANVQDTASLLVSLQARGLARTGSETWDALTELATRLASLARTAAETLADWVESATGNTGTQVQAVAADTLDAFSETATRAAQSLARTASETLASFAEAATRFLALPRTTSETLEALSELATRLASQLRTVTETLTAWGEAASRSAQSFSRTFSETLAAWSESASMGTVFIRVATETLDAFSEAATRMITLVRRVRNRRKP